MVIWGAMVGLGVAVHWALWIGPTLTPPVDLAAGHPWLTKLSNVTSTLGAPGMIATTRVAQRMFPRDLEVMVLSYGLSWALWLGLVWVALRAWKRLAARSRGVAPVEPPANPGRRGLFVHATFGVGAAATGSSLAYASLVEPFDLRITRRRIAIRDWPAALDGLRAVFIADTHLGPRVPEEHIRRAYALARALEPELILLGGDYVHNGPRYLPRAFALMAEGLPIRAVPTIAVLGNHDWYADGPAARRGLIDMGVEVVDNRRVFLDARTRRVVAEADARPGDAVCFAGVGDAWEDRVDFVAALADVDPAIPRIVLSHQPDPAEHRQLYERGYRVDLMLSGHTHGGQVRLPLLGSPIVPSQFGTKYAYGVNAGPFCPVLTTSGVGMSIVPLRVNMPPEIVALEFVRAG